MSYEFDDEFSNLLYVDDIFSILVLAALDNFRAPCHLRVAINVCSSSWFNIEYILPEAVALLAFFVCQQGYPIDSVQRDQCQTPLLQSFRLLVSGHLLYPVRGL